MLNICLTSTIEFKATTDNGLLDNYIAQIAQGATSALEELYKRTNVGVYGFALSILKNTQDAEDVLQDCYLNVWSGAKYYRSVGKPMAWVITIARNLCLQKMREYRKTMDIPVEDWEKYLEDHKQIAPEDRMILSECMKRLSDEERQIVVLHAVSGFKHREISSILKLPLPTVLSKYNRALKKLKIQLMKGEHHD